MVACPGHISESTKGIEIKRGKYIDVNKRKCRRQEPYSYLTFYLSYLSLFIFIKKVVFFVMSWCTCDVGLQVLSFIDHRYLGSIRRCQLHVLSCYTCLIKCHFMQETHEKPAKLWGCMR